MPIGTSHSSFTTTTTTATTAPPITPDRSYRVEYGPAILSMGWEESEADGAVFCLVHGDDASGVIRVLPDRVTMSPEEYVAAFAAADPDLYEVDGPYPWPDPWDSGAHLVRVLLDDVTWMQLYVAVMDGRYVEITLVTTDPRTCDARVHEFETYFMAKGFALVRE